MNEEPKQINDTGQAMYFKVEILDARWPETPLDDPGIMIMPGQEINWGAMIEHAIKMIYETRHPEEVKYAAGAIIRRADKTWTILPDHQPEYFSIRATRVKP